MGFQPITYSETEGSKEVQVCVQLFNEGALTAPLDVILSTEPGSATGKPIVINIELYMAFPIGCKLCTFLIV